MAPCQTAVQAAAPAVAAAAGPGGFRRRGARRTRQSRPRLLSVRRTRCRTNVMQIIAEKTGYPTDMLDLDLDLEADLGIDTVKQAEMFAAIRAAYDIPREDNLKLRDFPTLAHAIKFVYDRRPDLKPAGCGCRHRSQQLDCAMRQQPRPAAVDAVQVEGHEDHRREDRLSDRHARSRSGPRSRSRHRHCEAGGNVRGHPRGVRHSARRQSEAARLPDAGARNQVCLRPAAGSEAVCCGSGT